MKSNRRTAVVLGVLLISGMLFGMLSSVPVLEEPDYLNNLASIRSRVLIAVLFQAAMAVVYTGIAVLMYPIIKKYNEGLAAGYLGFRLIGAAFLFVEIISLLLLLLLSQMYVSAGQFDLPAIGTMGELLRTARDGINHIGMILPWSIGGLLLYSSFLKMKLVPKWLSIWGIAGSFLTLTATLMLMLDSIRIVDPVYFILNAPTAFLELSLSLFLIIKGFKPAVVNPSVDQRARTA